MLLPEDGKLYELIEGELYVSRQPSWEHQYTCGRFFRFLDEWNEQTGLGVVNAAPGLIFAEDDDVAPDLVWISKEKLATALGEDGKLHSAPELIIEVLSPGLSNLRRDREAKLKLYARRGVQEYWIADWQSQEVEVYRSDGINLVLWTTLRGDDSLDSPILPGFSCRVSKLFFQF
ncbi:MAG TPA: Uma2 family endonuclease [Blastocatellia bacterium]|nr:Uma2 family endonuclease [Blastocatellia bacterium]